MPRLKICSIAFAAVFAALLTACDDQPASNGDTVQEFNNSQQFAVNTHGQSYPHELESWIEHGEEYLDHEEGDLNNDGTVDVVLVTEKTNNSESRTRSVQLLIRNTKGVLQRYAKNDHLIMCSSCGGAFGDPYAGVAINNTTFTIHHYGGSNRRWSLQYIFRLQGLEWILDRVESAYAQALEEENKPTDTHVWVPKEKIVFQDATNQMHLKTP